MELDLQDVSKSITKSYFWRTPAGSSGNQLNKRKVNIMKTFTYTVRNAEQAYPHVITGVCNDGTYQDSRNGPTIELQGTTVVTIMKPEERMVFCPVRDANPFFHLAEGIWMLAGRNDTKYLTQYVASMANFSDEGLTFNAAYGHRMRKHFGFDQLELAVKTLRDNHDSRQAIIQLWDPVDLYKVTKDKACNMSMDLKIRNGLLNMRVNNRSNDIVWGMLGANVVHFSFIQEYIAAAVGVGMGYLQMDSHAAHVYTNLPKWNPIREKNYHDDYLGPINAKCKYSTGEVRDISMVTDAPSFIDDCEKFCNEEYEDLRNPFFHDIAYPMHFAYRLHKNGFTREAIEQLEDTNMTDVDWIAAGIEWLERRLATKTAKSVDVRPEINKETGKLEQ